MAVRDDFAAGEVLAAADLNDTFASKLPYSYGTATPSTTDSGFLWYDSNSTPAEVKFWDGAAFQALTSGKILQVVRATDTTRRTTTSTSLSDVTGMAVTITPTKSTSAILLVFTFYSSISSTSTLDTDITYVVADSSNNPISGAEVVDIGSSQFNYTGTGTQRHFLVIPAYATPATTSAVTYKLRFSVDNASASANVLNDITTGQVFALEIGA